MPGAEAALLSHVAAPMFKMATITHPGLAACRHFSQPLLGFLSHPLQGILGVPSEWHTSQLPPHSLVFATSHRSVLTLAAVAACNGSPKQKCGWDHVIPGGTQSKHAHSGSEPQGFRGCMMLYPNTTGAPVIVWALPSDSRCHALLSSCSVTSALGLFSEPGER